jgi:cysteine desulfurase
MIKERIYLDYNATSPLSKKSLEFLDKGDFYFANPASQHQSGKYVSKKINLIKDELLAFFNLDHHYDVLFHSGATEGMNIFFNLLKGDCFVYSSADHSLVEPIAKILEKAGVEVIKLEVDSAGMLNLNDVISKINQRSSKGACWMNYTWMNNETGIIWSLDSAVEIKKKCQISIHVDAVQTPGKFSHFRGLNIELDSYTYSGHKFGALKGIGFSFFKKDCPPKTLIHGGGQQNKLRSGTLNTYGIFSLL